MDPDYQLHESKSGFEKIEGERVVGVLDNSRVNKRSRFERFSLQVSRSREKREAVDFAARESFHSPLKSIDESFSCKTLSILAALKSQRQ